MHESRISSKSELFIDEGVRQDQPSAFLPPGTEGLDVPALGLLTLRVGKLLDLKSTANFENIKIKPAFWGEAEAPFLLRASNTCLSESDIVSCSGRYFIKFDH
jgi:hypothetical protein